MPLLRTLPLLLLACAVLAVPAQASKTQEVTFEAPRDLLDPATRDQTFSELDSLGVRALRVVLYWHDVAPEGDSRVKPKADMTDPSVYDWSRYAPVLDEAHKRGWNLHLTVSGPVPRWATNGARDTVTRPSPNEFRMFMTAVSRRFGGQVTRYAIWNEPNHPQFLAPQYDKRKRPVSPTIYRGLYAAALRGLADAGDTKPVVLGETAPVGTGKDVAPLTFLRRALCLNDRYKKIGKCSKVRVDGIAHHPYTRRSGPFYKPSGPNDVTIGVLSRLVKATDRLAKAGVVARRVPLYLTEFGIQSTPDPLYGVPLLRQNEYRNISERIAYNNSRVRAFSQYLLRDDLPVEGASKIARYGGFESGLRTSGGKDKPALAGFRLPLAAEKRGSGVRLWGMARPAGGRTTVEVQYRNGSKGSFRRLAAITTDARGAFTKATANRKGRQWRLRWTAGDGTTYTSPPVRAYG
ncbi:MAG: hypothetical protein HZB46_18620 [Solirubrobacterales bacterium]|nr:hypothetical protein [Solirubrobacterales bacterium]